VRGQGPMKAPGPGPTGHARSPRSARPTWAPGASRAPVDAYASGMSPPPGSAPFERLNGRRRRAIQRRVLEWYDAERRTFAFRGPREPYPVLVAEVMLQQTQAARGEGAWRAFMERFPRVADLAVASPADVLRAWAGLGYNRRALNLRLAAIAIMERHGGTFPRSIGELEALPGIGPYTARAVAAIAFGEPVGAVDTNVRRVLGRVAVGHGAARDPGSPLAARDLQALADGMVARDRPADWTSAVIDVGATLCSPRTPRCERCPLAADCAYAARRLGARSRPAPRPAVPGRVAEPAVPYERTTRWLRGRLVARLRELPDGAWATLTGGMGTHEDAAVLAALAALARDGLVELDEGGRARLPLR
jgi:A/G-specific adenine glycosylase